MKISNKSLDQLRNLHNEKLFVRMYCAHPGFEKPILDYIGAPNEKTRVRCELKARRMLKELIENIQVQNSKEYVMSVFNKHLKFFESEDTEEMEQITRYCERVMDALDIESSDGLLNTFLYGFDPTLFIKKEK